MKWAYYIYLYYNLSIQLYVTVHGPIVPMQTPEFTDSQVILSCSWNEEVYNYGGSMKLLRQVFYVK